MISEAKEAVCAFLWAKLKRKKIKQKQIAKIFHCSPSYVSKKMRSGDLSLEELLMLFAVTDSTPQEIGEVMYVRENSYRL